MREVTIEEAIGKGRIQLFWIPMFYIFLFGGASVAVANYYPEGNPVLPTLGGISALTVSWLWWSIKVVDWKIWAFSNVIDGKTLEKRAISRQLIWPRGSWFELTELKSKKEKALLKELYKKIDTAELKREIVIDQTLPEEMTIKYSMINLYIPLIFIIGCFYLILTDKYLIGIGGAVFFIYFAFNAYKKIKNNEFFFKLNAKGIILPHNFYPWQEIEEYFIERTGSGKTTNYYLIINGNEMYERISLEDVNLSAFTIEKYLDVYRSRFDVKKSISLKKSIGYQ